MKKTLKRALIYVLALAMVLGLATTAFASDNLGGQLTEEVAEQTETTDDAETTEVTAEAAAPEEVAAESAAEVEAVAKTEGKYAGVSSEIMAVIEELDDGPDYAEGELLVIYEDVESAECATVTMCANGETAEQTCGNETVLVTFDENEISMEDKIIELAKEENVKYVQPNYIYYLIDSVDNYEACKDMADIMTIRMENEVNDEFAEYQYYLSHVHMAEAWRVVEKYGTSKVKVAVIDTGALTTHEDLTNLNTDLCVDVTTKSGEPYDKQTGDDQGHGTHVTGIIGATANNGVGIAGGATLGKTDVSEKLELFTIDAFTMEYDTTEEEYIWYAKSEDVYKALIYATDKGAKVISMSLGMTEPTAEWQDDVLKEGIDYAYNHGAICVCAAGNDYVNSGTQSTYPSDYDKVISVIALDTIDYGYERWNECFIRAFFSNFGTAQDISAPGVWIVSDYNDDTYQYTALEGTSQATPIVSSVIALMFMINPNLNFDQVYNIITSTADDLAYTWEDSKQYNVNTGYLEYFDETATEGFDIYTAYGMINAEACVLALAPEVFSDVHKTNWFYSSVSDMYYRGIMTGLNEQNFGPYDSLHREQLAVMLWRLEGEEEVTYTGRFKDVKDGTWYTDAILWAYNEGIITGYVNGSFGVGDNITREQLATMLYRYAKYKWQAVYGEGAEGYLHYGLADLSGFKDGYAVSSWAKEAVQWAVGAGIITGKDNGTRIDPQGNAARCECAAMVQRFMDKFGF